jgi:alkylation response protein AidB-like acyl-CoA dehydrogenase
MLHHYEAPVEDLLFTMREVAGLHDVLALPAFDMCDEALVQAVLEQAARFASDALAPLNRSGDREGARLDGAEVRMPAGFQAAYASYVEAGWGGLAADPEYGGQGLPRLLWTAVQEMWKAANLGFSALPQLTLGAVEALMAHADEALRQRFLPRLVSGHWTGAMALTEPQAGSDLSAIGALATPHADGSWRLVGQKCFITYADHDLAENVVTLVLARTPGAPAGVKGLTLFLVPKWLVDDDGRLGARNDVRYHSLEHKLGFHAGPTGILNFGDAGGAVAYRVGALHNGLPAMFVMMNDARFSVGLEGVGLADRAWQQARAYAHERVQGRSAGSPASVPIVQHPDVRRMLLTMKALTEAMRAFAAVLASARDLGSAHPDAGECARQQRQVDFLTPVFKGWCTETGVVVANLGIQVHGGMGVVEETGAAQYLRDARAATLYEGTTGIQAADFVGRKLARDQGQAAHAVLAQMRDTVDVLGGIAAPAFATLQRDLRRAVEALANATDSALAQHARQPAAALAVSVPLLELWGTVIGGWLLAHGACRAHALRQDPSRPQRYGAAFLDAKVATARFYGAHLLSRATGLADIVCEGAAACLDDAATL